MKYYMAKLNSFYQVLKLVNPALIKRFLIKKILIKFSLILLDATL